MHPTLTPDFKPELFIQKKCPKEKKAKCGARAGHAQPLIVAHFARQALHGHGVMPWCSNGQKSYGQRTPTVRTPPGSPENPIDE